MTLPSTRFSTVNCAKQTGISLLEVSLSVGIIAVILVLATMLYYTTSNNQQINVLTTNMGALTDAETRYALNNQGKYSDQTDDLVNLGYLSPSLASCGTGSTTGSYTNCAVPNPWGGTITLTLNGTTGVTLQGRANVLTVCKQINEQSKGDMVCDDASGSSSLTIKKVVGSTS